MSAAPFFTAVREMNAIVRSDEALGHRWDRLRPLLQDEDVLREFFKTIDTPDWLPILKGEGYFNDPPTAIQVEGGLRSRPWFVSKYLVRIAAVAPEVVAEE